MNLDPITLIGIYMTLAVVLRLFFPNKLTAVLFVVVLICSSALFFKDHRLAIADAWTRGKGLLASTIGKSETTSWPPKLDMAYPEINMIDQNGDITSLEEFRGKVVLIEVIGMTCPACVSLSGGQLYGGYGATLPQSNLESIEEYVERFSGESLDNPDLVLIQILLSDPNGQPTNADDAQTWAYHFRLERENGRVVLGGSKALFSGESLKMVPGFHLLDRDLVLRADSCGHNPQDKLYEKLIPMIPELLGEQHE